MGKLLTPDDVAERLGVGRRTAMDRMKREMRCVNVGLGNQRPRWAVDEKDFERWLEGQKQVPVQTVVQAVQKRRTRGAVPMIAPMQHIPYRKSSRKAGAK